MRHTFVTCVAHYHPVSSVDARKFVQHRDMAFSCKCYISRTLLVLMFKFLTDAVSLFYSCRLPILHCVFSYFLEHFALLSIGQLMFNPKLHYHRFNLASVIIFYKCFFHCLLRRYYEKANIARVWRLAFLDAVNAETVESKMRHMSLKFI